MKITKQEQVIRFVDAFGGECTERTLDEVIEHQGSYDGRYGQSLARSPKILAGRISRSAKKIGDREYAIYLAAVARVQAEIFAAL
jgi:hypothetical protein